MADISVTAANVAKVTGGVCRDFNAAVTIVAGEYVYLDANNVWRKAQCDGMAIEAGSGTRTGVALHGALAGQPLAVQETGTITIGGTVAVGTVYAVSAAAGGIAPVADLVSTNKLSLVGVGVSTTVIDMAIKAAYAGGYTGVAVA